MLVHFGHERIQAEWSRSVVCIGTFDGVHLGHRELISMTVARGRELECPSIVVTFDRHPAATLAPEREPLPVSTMEQNLAILASLGVSCVVVLPFDREMSEMSADSFFDEILKGALKAEETVVGHDFAFGAGRVGTTDWLRGRIPTSVVEAQVFHGERASSSGIRRLIEAGELEEASAFLGRPYAIDGVVVAGQKLGRTLGFPTVNLARSARQILPPDGIYAGSLRTLGGDFRAAISVGYRPTVEGDHRTIEAYLLEYPGDSLYGQAVRLEFWSYLRGEEKFGSLDDLKVQMAKDVDAVARYRAEGTESAGPGLGQVWARSL